MSRTDVTLPKKGELEKLHVEKTVFSITDKNNKVSTFTADQMDETEPGSKLVKIINPNGRIPTGKGDDKVDVEANIGYYDQNASKVKIIENVKAVYPDGTIALTDEAEYDFKTAYGFGNQKVHAHGNWGKLWADGFKYYQNNEVFILTGKSKITNQTQTLWADKEVRYYQLQNRIEADKNVKIIGEKNTIYADFIKAFLQPGKEMKIEKIEASGNVRIETPEGTACGDYGLYYPDKEEAELHENVVISQNGNVIYGQKAVTNLKTSISRIISGNKKARVSGVIAGTTIKGSKNEKKQ